MEINILINLHQNLNNIQQQVIIVRALNNCNNQNNYNNKWHKIIYKMIQLFKVLNYNSSNKNQEFIIIII